MPVADPHYRIPSYFYLDLFKIKFIKQSVAESYPPPTVPFASLSFIPLILSK